MKARIVTMPLRLWLALALIGIVGVPAITTWGLSQLVDQWQQTQQTQLASVRRVLGTDVARWRDRTWQHRASHTFAALGVDVGLVDKEAGRSGPVFANVAARQLMSEAGLVPTSSRGRKQASSGKWTAGAAGTSGSFLAYREIPIVASSRSPGQVRVVGVADVWFTRPPAGQVPTWLPSAGGLASLVLVLAVVTAVVGRSVLRPLAAMSGAAQRMGSGDWEGSLPSSPAREVAAVSAALTAMSARLREATRRQHELEQERRVFIGAIAHDLRTPLFTLSAYLGGLRDGVAATPEKSKHYIEVCQEQATAMERLIADLFAYTKIEYLEQEPRREPVDMGALLRDIAERTQPRAAAHGVHLNCTGEPETYMLTGDPQWLTRAIENLLDNALRHTPAGGCIALHWTRERAALVVTIEDTGPGIAAQDLPHIFTPLYRADTSRNRQTGGTGLGLTIARRIAQAHGGNLIAGNGSMGGAAFTMTVPSDPPGAGA